MGTLVLVRHGQASFLDADYDRLSTKGEAQARRLGEHWAAHGVGFDTLWTGPRARHARTAEIVADAYARSGRALPAITRVDDLDEMQAEQLLKRTLPELIATDPDLAAAMRDVTANDIPAHAMRSFQRASAALLARWARGELEIDVEPFTAFCERVERAIAQMTQDAAKGARVAAFTSGGPIVASMRLALGTAADTTIGLIWRLRNASITEFAFSGERFTLTGYNAIPHLQDASLVTYV